MINILVTGAKGFIGSNLIKTLQKNKQVKILSFTKEHNYEDLENFILASDFIFHLAGEVRPNSSKEDFENANVTLTKYITGLLTKHKKKTPILLVSTIHASLLKNEYGKTKRASELLVEQYSKENQINCYIFRLPHVFGEGCKPNYNSVISTWIYNSLNDLEITVFDRSIEMDYVYVQDVILEFISMINTQETTIYHNPNIVYHTTLGEVVDYIYEFREHKDDQNYSIQNNEFKQKLLTTYKHYRLQEIK